MKTPIIYNALDPQYDDEFYECEFCGRNIPKLERCQRCIEHGWLKENEVEDDTD